jgi:putative flippase GtrA
MVHGDGLCGHFHLCPIQFCAPLFGLFAIQKCVRFIHSFNSKLMPKNSLVSCSSNEMIQSGIGTIMRVNTIAISLSLVTVYILVWVISFMAKTSATMSESSKHLLKSLIIIIGLDLSCVCLKNVTMLLIKMFTTDSMVTSGLSVAFSFLTIAVYSANGPVLYVIRYPN